MLMLGATRPQSVRAIRPDAVSVRSLISLGRAPLPAEERMREIEAASVGWPASFTRRKIGKDFSITLEKRDVNAPVPVVRTAWVQTFGDERARDVLFAWLCDRIDRWQAWSELAWEGSGARLSGHLLGQIGLSLRGD